MKRVLLGIVAVGMMAGAANAATLSLRWASTTSDKISLAPSSSATIEVVLDGLLAGDTLSGAYFSMEALAGNPVTHVSNSAAIPNWTAGGATGLPFGTSQFAVGSPLAGGPNDVVGPVPSLLLGSFVIQFSDLVSPNGTEYQVAFNAAANNQLVFSDGSFWGGPRVDGYEAYSGYWTFGKGSPGITQMTSSIPRDPLIITKVPEPASLGLLAIGGFAVMMRRRG